MYGRNFSGGTNRTHSQIERAERIDSFEAAKVDRWGTVFASSGTPLDCDHQVIYGPGDLEMEMVELVDGRWSLQLTRIKNGFGGSRAFWLCPRCGRRVRYLYFKNKDFLCRFCARLNYRCQQRTHDSNNYALDGLRLAREKLHWGPPFPVAPVDFPHIVPDKPRYMHRNTYFRYLARYWRYQKQYQAELMAELSAILRRLG